jgi:hypothetical protein
MPGEGDDGGAPVFDQDAFGGRGDGSGEGEAAVNWKYADGTTGDTAVNAKNRDWTQTVDENFRLRFVIQEVGGLAADNFQETYQYNLNGTGWNPVATNDTVPLKSVISLEYTSGSDTTRQLGSGTFISNNDAQIFQNVSGSATLPDLTGNTEFECENCFQIVGSQVSHGNTLQVRIVRSGSIALDTYTNTPTITINKPTSARRVMVVS